MDINSIKTALQAANNAPFQAQRASGCGRAYVVISIPKKLEDGSRNAARTKTLNLIKKACGEMGLLYLTEVYGCGKVPGIYIGYDNADGRALAKSVVFAETLRQHGIPCYDEAVGD